MDDFNIQAGFGVLGLLFICFMGWHHLVWIRRERQQIQKANRWPTSEGLIESGALLAEGHGRPSFRFSYQVSSEYYSGSLALVPQRTFSAEMIRHFVGTRVRLRINPSDPSNFVILEKQIQGLKVEPQLDAKVVAPYALNGLRISLVLGFVAGWTLWLTSLLGDARSHHSDLYIIEVPEWISVLSTLFLLLPFLISSALAFSRKRNLVACASAIAMALFGYPVFLILVMLIVAPPLIPGFLVLGAMGLPSKAFLVVGEISLLVFIAASLWIVIAGFWIARIHPRVFAVTLFAMIMYLFIGGEQLDSMRGTHQRQLLRTSSELSQSR